MHLILNHGLFSLGKIAHETQFGVCVSRQSALISEINAAEQMHHLGHLYKCITYVTCTMVPFFHES